MAGERIQLLEGASGTTFVTTGLVILRERYDKLLNILKNFPNLNTREGEMISAWLHEIVHWIQALSTSFVYSYSVNYIRGSLQVLQGFDEFLANPSRFSLIQECQSALLDRSFVVSVQDICEGVAVIESYKMAKHPPNVSDFLTFRDEFYPGDQRSVYRRTFDTLAYAIGTESAFHLLSPLSYVALQSDNPGRSFDFLIRERLPHVDLHRLMNSSTRDIFYSFGMDPNQTFVFLLDDFPKEDRHPFIHRYSTEIRNRVGLDKFLEIAGRPSLLNATSLDKNDLTMFFPPTVLSSFHFGEPSAGMNYGIARQDKDFRVLVVKTQGIVGAAERLVIRREDKQLFMFCPHHNCPHYAAALCYRYYAPPSPELGWQGCGFPEDFRFQTGRYPNLAWTEVKEVEFTPVAHEMDTRDHYEKQVWITKKN